MSLENHPNFHACQFTVDIVRAFYESFNEQPRQYPENMTDQISDFVASISTKIDEFIENETATSDENGSLIVSMFTNNEKFNVLDFATTIWSSYLSSFRGLASIDRRPSIEKEFVVFVRNIEAKIKQLKE